MTPTSTGHGNIAFAAIGYGGQAETQSYKRSFLQIIVVGSRSLTRAEFLRLLQTPAATVGEARRQNTPRPRLRKDERKGIPAIESASCLNACQRISSRPERHDTILREMNVVRGNLVR